MKYFDQRFSDKKHTHVGSTTAKNILPLIEPMQNYNINQKWYANDNSVVGSLENLLKFTTMSFEHGKQFGCIKDAIKG